MRLTLFQSTSMLMSLVIAASAAAVTMDWVTVGDPGNPADTTVMNDGTTGYGAVPYVYQIGKFDVTNAQYAEFLNAVAQTDPNGVWNPDMTNYFVGGITRSGSSGSYSYSTIAGRENWPVNYVSFHDALRFANWFQNGQPTGAQDASTTEDGAYTMKTESYPDYVITRSPGAKVFLPTENEWYKAAYYDALSASYFLYPAGSSLPTICSTPTAAVNSANCGRGVDRPTDIGSYTNSTSPYGAFDMGGNVWQWNEGIRNTFQRGLRGGSWDDFGGLNTSRDLASPIRYSSFPEGEYPAFGFRLAPEPNAALLQIVGTLTVFGLAGWRRARAAPTRVIVSRSKDRGDLADPTG